jgi:hypothetical protein
LKTLHSAQRPKTPQNTTSINIEHRPNHEERTLELITCKKQNNTKTKKEVVDNGSLQFS